MAKDDGQGRKVIASNRKARHDYIIEDTYEAGLALMGTEVKSLRMGRASLVDAFCQFDSRGELWLEHAHIPEYLQGSWTHHSARRRRKLLLLRFAARHVRRLDLNADLDHCSTFRMDATLRVSTAVTASSAATSKAVTQSPSEDLVCAWNSAGTSLNSTFSITYDVYGRWNLNGWPLNSTS